MKSYIIFKRELKSLLHSPLTYVVASLFILIVGYYFSIMLIRSSRVDHFPILLRYMSNILLVFVPILTMHLLAGERASGSIALLLTSPVSEWAVVIGKFCAVLLVTVSCIGLTLPFPALLFSVGNPDPGPIIAGYLGIILLAGLFCAIGIFASSVTATPMIAAVIGFGLMTFFGVVDRLTEFVGEHAAPLVTRLGFIEPCRHLFGGVIYAKHVIYFLTLSFFFLFATQRMLCSNRWR